MTIFGDRAYKVAVKVKPGLGIIPNPRTGILIRKGRPTEDRVTQRKGHVT